MKKTGVCVICSTPFQYVRGSKKTCSQKCRKAKSRLNVEIKTTIKPTPTNPNPPPLAVDKNAKKHTEDLLWNLAYLQAEKIDHAYVNFAMHESDLFNLVQQSNTLLNFIKKVMPSFYRSRLVIDVLRVSKKIKYLHLDRDENGWINMQEVPEPIFKPCFEIIKIQNGYEN